MTSEDWRNQVRLKTLPAQPNALSYVPGHAHTLETRRLQ
jgi:hypothetical protein